MSMLVLPRDCSLENSQVQRKRPCRLESCPPALKENEMTKQKRDAAGRFAKMDIKNIADMQEAINQALADGVVGVRFVDTESKPLYARSLTEEDIEPQKQRNKELSAKLDEMIKKKRETLKQPPEHHNGERCTTKVAPCWDVDIEQENIDHFEYVELREPLKAEWIELQFEPKDIRTNNINFGGKHWILRPVMKPTQKKMTEDWAHGKHYGPEFRAGDWAVRPGLVGGRDNFPFQLTVGMISSFHYNRDGQPVVPLPIQLWVIAHATEEDWWFEKCGYEIRARYEGNNIKYDVNYKHPRFRGCEDVYWPHDDWLAKALDIPIMPEGWEEK